MDKIIQKILDALKDNPSLPVDEVVKTVAKEFNFSPEEMSELEESFKILDTINDKAAALEEARKDGKTRNGWVKEELSKISDSCGSKGEAILSEIANGTKTGLDNILTQE